jgi:hypothetical protein
VKTYPIPSSKYDELVCTAGVTETGDFVRLYPIDFRDLPDNKQFTKYQWIEVKASKHTGSDKRPESYRPVSESIEICGEPIKSNPGNWRGRGLYVLKNKAESIEYLRERQKFDKTSLGIFKPKNISDLVIQPDSSTWNPKFIAELKQQRIFENRTISREPPRKVPFKFIYKFHCDDENCNGHGMSIIDWEVGALFWKRVDKGWTHMNAAEDVKRKFLEELCGEDKDTHFFVGTPLAYPNSWMVLGVYYPKVEPPSLFD